MVITSRFEANKDEAKTVAVTPIGRAVMLKGITVALDERPKCKGRGKPELRILIAGGTMFKLKLSDRVSGERIVGHNLPGGTAVEVMLKGCAESVSGAITLEMV